ncbi:HalOD1 output domain-containing protein [Haloarcula litorea]|uniref:HalOD1 output domain-containing protein n=1 Tax=Haloarcula litorea TaxID=3032579 RepID=UPI0023E802D7|nr:HalOD1 output domain-containing protein [Halomicroarcula sp. GDY20]
MSTRLSGQPAITLLSVDGREEYYLRTAETVPLAVVVCLGVAHLSGRSPSELPPLGEVVDADALDRVFGGSGRGNPSVTFTYADHTVTVLSRQYCRIVPPTELPVAGDDGVDQRADDHQRAPEEQPRDEQDDGPE